jgi:transposase-like protein
VKYLYERGIILSMKEKCPYCSSVRFVYRGYRYNEKSKKRLRLCKKCGRKFTSHDRYFRMRFSPEEIRRAVTLYKKGFSLAEAKLRMEREGVRVSRWTILKWHRKYTKGKKK